MMIRTNVECWQPYIFQNQISTKEIQGPDVYLFKLSLCNRLGYERPTPPHLFNRYQHPFGHTSGAAEIIFIGPIYRLVAGGGTSPWTKPSPPVVIFRRIGVRVEIRNPEPCAIQHKASQDGTAKQSPPTEPEDRKPRHIVRLTAN
jgi:hypothetical protein